MPREKREGMSASITKTAIKIPLDNGQWQIWCKYDCDEEINFQNNTDFFSSKSQTNTAKAARLVFSLCMTFLLGNMSQQQHQVSYQCWEGFWWCFLWGMLLSKNVWNVGKWDDQAMNHLFYMEYLHLKAEIILIQVSIFCFQVKHTQKIITLL